MRINKKIALQLFVSYCCTLFYIVFFTPNRYRNYAYDANVIPFVYTVRRFYEQGNQHFWAYYIGYWGNIFGNVILFLPFGFLIKTRNPQKRSLTLVLYGFLVSTGIEVLQLLLQIGVCDIDDVILNVAGAGAGIFIYNKMNVVN